MAKFGLFLAVIIVPFVSAAPAEPTERDCVSTRLEGTHYWEVNLWARAVLNVTVGQTVSAVIVVRSRSSVP